MKKLIVSAFMVTLFATMVLGQATAPSIEGNWLGSLDLGGAKLRLVFKITKTAAGYQAKFDSPDQGATDLDVDSVTVQDGVVNFEAKKFSLNYEGKLNDTGDEMQGTFSQGPASLPLILKRVTEAPKVGRPQDPKKPYSYDEEEVSYKNAKDNVKLAGTLT